MNRSAKRPRGLPPVRRTEAGVVLIVVLIMLVVIGLVSASAMRNALSSDMISNNARLESIAKQSAQIALRYCEQEAQKVQSSVTSSITVQPAPTTPSAAPAWQNYSNWTGTMATTLSENDLSSQDSAFKLTKLPQCMAEYSPVDPNIIVVTARGFGPDYDTTANSGSVVWLQSVIAFSP